MGIVRDIMVVLGVLTIAGSIATQCLWGAGVVLGAALVAVAVWWSWAAHRAAVAQRERAKREQGL